MEEPFLKQNTHVVSQAHALIHHAVSIILGIYWTKLLVGQTLRGGGGLRWAHLLTLGVRVGRLWSRK